MNLIFNVYLFRSPLRACLLLTVLISFRQFWFGRLFDNEISRLFANLSRLELIDATNWKPQLTKIKK